MRVGALWGCGDGIVFLLLDAFGQDLVSESPRVSPSPRPRFELQHTVRKAWRGTSRRLQGGLSGVHFNAV